jgi:hypothetical protein
MIENIKDVTLNNQVVKGIEAPSPFSSSPIEGEENGREGESGMILGIIPAQAGIQKEDVDSGSSPE